MNDAVLRARQLRWNARCNSPINSKTPVPLRLFPGQLSVSNINSVAVVSDGISGIDPPCLKGRIGYERFGKRLRTAD